MTSLSPPKSSLSTVCATNVASTTPSTAKIGIRKGERERIVRPRRSAPRRHFEGLRDLTARSDRAAPGERAAERDLVGVLQVAADRQAGGQPRDRDVRGLLAQHLGDVQ